MFIVSRQFDFCYGHRLLGYAGKCRHLHGHNGTAIITFESTRLDEHGMVLDFAEIKRLVEGWLNDHLDHRMILARNDPAVGPFRHDLQRRVDDRVELLDGEIGFGPMLDAIADALPFAAVGDDERYQAEVMRLAPAPKADPRKPAKDD